MNLSFEKYIMPANISLLTLLNVVCYLNFLLKVIVFIFLFFEAFKPVYEKVFFYFFLFFSTTWKKYLKEKHWTTKEKVAWARAWAWKHEGNLNTYKGFYIPTTLPQTEQGKFFQKKWSEDEDRLWDLSLKKKKDFINKQETRKTFSEDGLTFKEIQQKSLFGFYTNKANYFSGRAWKKLAQLTVYPIKFLKKKKKYNFNLYLKFAKKFLKSPFLPIVIQEWQHLWSYLNMGENTTHFLNFFFINYFPMFLINFNFLKIKILLVNWFNSFFMSSLPIEKNCLNWNLVINFYSIFLKKKNINYLQNTFINNLYFFFKIFKNWKGLFFNMFFFKEFLVNFIIYNCFNTLVGRLLYFYLKLIYNNFNFSVHSKKKNLTQLFLTRLTGSLLFHFQKKWNWKKSFFQLNFLTSYSKLNSSFENLKFVSLLLSNKKIMHGNLSSTFFEYPYTYQLIETCFAAYNIFLYARALLDWPLCLTFLDNFTLTGNKVIQNVFPLGWSLQRNFYFFLKKRIESYERVRYLLYTSFSQQVKMVDKINVPDVLFKYIIWKGKKLTAWTVFLKFLRKFKRKYNLPGLAIFAHAMLYIEPKVWLKEKKMAGRLYQIPIYISSSWSCWIAIWWLLQAAKKWKWASITDSLAQEVWDACFKRGAAFNNKEVVQQTVKRNKAYLRWL